MVYFPAANCPNAQFLYPPGGVAKQPLEKSVKKVKTCPCCVSVFLLTDVTQTQILNFAVVQEPAELP